MKWLLYHEETATIALDNSPTNVNIGTLFFVTSSDPQEIIESLKSVIAKSKVRIETDREQA